MERWLWSSHSVLSNSLLTPWTLVCQGPLSMGFSGQGYWDELPFAPPGNLPNPGIEPESPALEGRFFTTEPPGKPKWKDYSITLYIIQHDIQIMSPSNICVFCSTDDLHFLSVCVSVCVCVCVCVNVSNRRLHQMIEKWCLNALSKQVESEHVEAGRDFILWRRNLGSERL